MNRSATQPAANDCALIGVLAALAMLTGCSGKSEAPPRTRAEPATYTGSEACAECHAGQHAAWKGSHHDLAMQAANAKTVLGDFEDARLRSGGGTTTFTRADANFVVRTEGADGALREYRVAYTFGIEPLQQYLLEMPDGRLQAFTIAWDTRPAEAGGQRWFDLQRGEAVEPGDPLHWTGYLQRWNSSCAECHSTRVDKNFDPGDGSYATTFAGTDVGCEACHGPGSSHAAAPTEHALALEPVRRSWTYARNAPIAHREPAARADAELETCASCHSRRSQLTDDVVPGAPLLDALRPAFLTEPLYHADGRIRDEVFVYGSFVQSAMHAAGVGCSDCHDPHRTQLRAEGNAVCGGCHRPSVYDRPEHHRHAQGTAGAECVSCHMPDETYMVIDARRDHSFRVPRPDLSVRLGTPNACSGCHDEPAAWAAERVREWFPEGRSGRFHFAEALYAGREWTAGRGALLGRVVGDSGTPAIVRATALGLLAEQIDAAAIETIAAALESGEPLVELAALEALGAVPVDLRAELGQRFLTAELRALRFAAAEALVPARGDLSTRRRADLDAAVEELRDSLRFNADRPEALLARASLERALGRPEAAQAALRESIERVPGQAAGYTNLADLYRSLGRDADAERVLREGLERAGEAPALVHALGLTLVRLDRRDEALPLLRRAAELDADEPRFAYVYGVALNSLASTAEALAALTRTHERFPGHLETLVALATIHRDAGDPEAALRYANRITAISPANPTARALVDELE